MESSNRRSLSIVILSCIILLIGMSGYVMSMMNPVEVVEVKKYLIGLGIVALIFLLGLGMVGGDYQTWN